MRRALCILSGLVAVTGLGVENIVVAALMMAVGFGLAYLIGRTAEWEG